MEIQLLTLEKLIYYFSGTLLFFYLLPWRHQGWIALRVKVDDAHFKYFILKTCSVNDSVQHEVALHTTLNPFLGIRASGFNMWFVI